jgi:hypothetical protein
MFLGFPDPHPLFRGTNPRIRLFPPLLCEASDADPDPNPLVRGMDPDPALDPDPSLIMQK